MAQGRRGACSNSSDLPASPLWTRREEGGGTDVRAQFIGKRRGGVGLSAGQRGKGSGLASGGTEEKGVGRAEVGGKRGRLGCWACRGREGGPGWAERKRESSWAGERERREFSFSLFYFLFLCQNPIQI